MYGNLKVFRESLGLSQKDFAKSLGLGLTTYNGYETGARDPKSDFWVTVAEKYHVSVDYLMGYDGDNKKAPAISAEAMRVARSYDRLDAWGQRVVSDVIADEQARVEASAASQSDIEREMRKISLIGQRFAAGAAEPDADLMWEDYYVPADSPADFAIHVNGVSMEPYLHDGSIALGVKRYPRDGEVGAFLIPGDGFIVKQFFTDGTNLYLLSANRAAADQDRVFLAAQKEYADVRCLGTILTDKPLPRVRV